MGGAQHKLKQNLGFEAQEHQRLGHIQKAIEPVEGQDEPRQIMFLSRQVENQKLWDAWLKQFKKVDDTQTRDILLLPEKYDFQKVGMCGSNGLARLKYDYFQFILQTQIQNRFKMKKEFLQTQIWYLLYNMIRAGNKFQLLKRKIGNVHPNNILINENGQIKIISTCSMPGEVDNYQKLIQNRKQTVYLAPEQINLDMIEKGQYPSHVDPCTAEVFCIGLTILSSGTLQDCNIIYSQNPIRINREHLNRLLKIFGEKYNSYLCSTVYSMLAFNPQQRKKASEIYKVLLDYENQILELEPFLPQNQNQNSRGVRNSTNTGGYQIYQQPQPQPQLQAQMINSNLPYGGYQQSRPASTNYTLKSNQAYSPYSYK